MNQALCIKTLHSGGVITNYYCSAKCRHCLYNSSPSWPKRYMDEGQAGFVFHRLKQLGCHSVHIGGGEPLLKPDGLFTVLKAAKEAGVEIEYVETNSSWFRDASSCDEALQKLKSAGLDTLLLSISPFHNEYIPFNKVKQVASACSRNGISVFPWVREFAPDLERFDCDSTHSMDEFEAVFGAQYLAGLPSRYGLSFGGRALKTYRSMMKPRDTASILAESGGCAELCNTSHFHVDLFGNYVPGKCTGLAIRFEDLGKPLDPDEYPLISLLYTKGVQGLCEAAANKYGFKPAGSYVSKCDLCVDIRRFLVLEKGMETKELQPLAHYSQV